MAFRVILTDGASPAEQIRDQIRGLIATDRIAAGERLPSVRQLAKDLGIAPGTVAKAYRSLEQQGLLQTRVGGGTRISPTASTMPPAVIDHAHALARASTDADVSLEDTIRVLRAVWPEPRVATDDAGREHLGSTP
ncbi:GntR family transcriptional regulator [Georgenia sp. 10Sc9-8]|uniref:GntR family transcriptional regulator n=1 Tax=Georgenia halotolerans TaxID=3028317 RepID=A0ABT5U1K7_9MICO|nr:GntR family transcriptional regulator [Georgenia halotolerans]